MLVDAFAVQSPLSVPTGVETTACVAVATTASVAEGDAWAVVGEELWLVGAFDVTGTSLWLYPMRTTPTKTTAASVSATRNGM